MLLVVPPEHVASIREWFERWDLHSDVIGEITDTQRMVVREGGAVVCELPLAMVIDEVPLRHPESLRPSGLSALLREDPLAAAGAVDARRGAAASCWPAPTSAAGARCSAATTTRWATTRSSPRVATPRWCASAAPPARSRSPPTATRGFAALDPRVGAAIAVCEAARNVVATGATPLAVTNCLNFGNPEKPEVFWQLQEAIEGIAEACRALDTPVVSGNVSLYNDSNGISIDPTAVIGMVGHIADVEKRVGAGFAADGDEIALVGPLTAELGGSEYQRLAHGVNSGPRPELDLGLERRVQQFVLEAIDAGLVRSCHDLSDGGLAVALAECCILGDRGASIVDRGCDRHRTGRFEGGRYTLRRGPVPFPHQPREGGLHLPAGAGWTASGPAGALGQRPAVNRSASTEPSRSR